MFKKIIYLSTSLHDKLKKYKEENDFSSISAVIRYILNQFFSNNKQ